MSGPMDFISFEARLDAPEGVGTNFFEPIFSYYQVADCQALESAVWYLCEQILFEQKCVDCPGDVGFESFGKQAVVLIDANYVI
ncbi:hypothetical protein BpHYR1_019653 [Brachionus plicatilis]|uniref:Uncharacterized protein n=1 Tax=Brachionus plicatilis TaxID=10195 RepID=A0A3M7Q6W6_BRAPC|nr:hypothetical protein BpHYR1_019653 [Brachionus plicatilis]